MKKRLYAWDWETKENLLEKSMAGAQPDGLASKVEVQVGVEGGIKGADVDLLQDAVDVLLHALFVPILES